MVRTHVQSSSRQLSATLSKAPDLIPGLRQRLVAELDRSGIDATERVRYLSVETGRAAQSVMRWLSDRSPGLPDLRSLAILCLRLEVDANWMLGLVRLRRPFPKESAHATVRELVPRMPSADWTSRLDFHMDRLAQGYDVYLMKGDDMAPVIGDDMPFLVDGSVSAITGNGIYFLTLSGVSMVRFVERTGDTKYRLRCANERYEQMTVDIGKCKKAEFEVIGKVTMAFELKRF
ncbi:S24 family peptidase [Massilia sp. YMA4]|uniref:S24 family peptidase n=1 Tax=[Empedobacter] haloabium TaxID=592317 RepID=A0ABZ1URT4_9BURK|nr:S24 family peptidase [Massilia sp. YMA4]